MVGLDRIRDVWERRRIRFEPYLGRIGNRGFVDRYRTGKCESVLEYGSSHGREWRWTTGGWSGSRMAGGENGWNLGESNSVAVTKYMRAHDFGYALR